MKKSIMVALSTATILSGLAAGMAGTGVASHAAEAEQTAQTPDNENEQTVTFYDNATGKTVATATVKKLADGTWEKVPVSVIPADYEETSQRGVDFIDLDHGSYEGLNEFVRPVEKRVHYNLSFIDSVTGKQINETIPYYGLGWDLIDFIYGDLDFLEGKIPAGYHLNQMAMSTHDGERGVVADETDVRLYVTNRDTQHVQLVYGYTDNVVDEFDHSTRDVLHAPTGYRLYSATTYGQSIIKEKIGDGTLRLRVFTDNTGKTVPVQLVDRDNDKPIALLHYQFGDDRIDEGKLDGKVIGEKPADYIDDKYAWLEGLSKPRKNESDPYIVRLTKRADASDKDTSTVPPVIDLNDSTTDFNQFQDESKDGVKVEQVTPEAKPEVTPGKQATQTQTQSKQVAVHGVATIQKNAVMVLDKNLKPTKQTLNPGTSWKIFDVTKMQDGKVYYNVGGDHYIPVEGAHLKVSSKNIKNQQSVTFDAVGTINYHPGYGIQVFEADGKTSVKQGKTLKKLPAGMRYHIFGMKTIGNKLYYNVGNNTFVEARCVILSEYVKPAKK